MNKDLHQAFSQLASSKDWWIVTIEFSRSFAELLRQDVLLRLIALFWVTPLAWIVFTKKQTGMSWDDAETRELNQYASYLFDVTTRAKNLGFHRDAIDRPESVDLALTWLLSPANCFSDKPTILIPTHLVDAEVPRFEYIQSLMRQYPWEFQEIHLQICARLAIDQQSDWIKPLAYWTLVQNSFLAHMALNIKLENVPLEMRDQLTQWVLKQHGNDAAWVSSKGWEISLLFFPNWLWPDRRIAHTRFKDQSDGNAWWIMTNFSIDTGWVIRWNRSVWDAGQWINYVHWLTNIGRATILPASI